VRAVLRNSIFAPLHWNVCIWKARLPVDLETAAVQSTCAPFWLIDDLLTAPASPAGELVTWVRTRSLRAKLVGGPRPFFSYSLKWIERVMKSFHGAGWPHIRALSKPHYFLVYGSQVRADVFRNVVRQVHKKPSNAGPCCGARSASKPKGEGYLRSTLSRRQLQGFVMPVLRHKDTIGRDPMNPK
jgi:hypothetical protein